MLVDAACAGGTAVARPVDLVLAVIEVRPDTVPAMRAGVRLGARGAIVADQQMRTGVLYLVTAGNCVLPFRTLALWPILSVPKRSVNRAGGVSRLKLSPTSGVSCYLIAARSLP